MEGDPWDEEEEWGVCWDFQRRTWDSGWSGGGWKSSQSGAQKWASYGEQQQQGAADGPFQPAPLAQYGQGQVSPFAPDLAIQPPPPPGEPPPGSAGPSPWGFPMAEGPYFGDVAKAMAACVAKGKSKGGGKGKLLEGPFAGEVATSGSGYGWGGGTWWKGSGGRGGRGGWKGGGWQPNSWNSSWGGPWNQDEGNREEQPPGLDGAHAAGGRAAGSGAGPCGRGGGFSGSGRAGGMGRGGGPRSKGGTQDETQWQQMDLSDFGATARAAEKEGLLAQIDAALQEPGCALQRSDFDGRVRQFLASLRATGGPDKVQDALEMISSYTAQKSRASIGNWPAYLLTLLRRFEPDLAQKGRSRGKGSAGRSQPPQPPPPPHSSWQAPSRSAMPPTTPQEEAQPPAPPVAAAPAPSPPQVPPQAVEAEEAGQEEEEEEEEEEEAVTPEGEVLELPPGWEDGRRALLEEVGRALEPRSGRQPVCPFTGKPLDCPAAFVTHVATCLSSAAPVSGDSQRSPGLACHVAGLARCRDFAECPRAAAAAGVAGVRELASLPEDATAFTAASAATSAASAQPGAAAVSGTILEEIALELAAEMLRGPWLSPAAGFAL